MGWCRRRGKSHYKIDLEKAIKLAKDEYEKKKSEKAAEDEYQKKKSEKVCLHGQNRHFQFYLILVNII